MRELRGFVDVLLKRRGRTRGDLYELSVASFTSVAHYALGQGERGERVSRRAVGAILVVLVLANLEQGGWFRRGPARHSRRKHHCR
jgi:hypothetical protein